MPHIVCKLRLLCLPQLLFQVVHALVLQCQLFFTSLHLFLHERVLLVWVGNFFIYHQLLDLPVQLSHLSLQHFILRRQIVNNFLILSRL